jgi:hypothetical protein
MKALCHCLSCRKVTGSTNTTCALVPTKAFSITSGSNNLKSFSTIHETGLKFTFKFCSTCGTTIYKEAESGAFGDVFIVMAGTLDKDPGEKTMGLEDVKIGAELFVKYRVSWLEGMGEVGQCQEFA